MGLLSPIGDVGGGIHDSSRISGIPKSRSDTMGLRIASREGGVPGGVVDLIDVAGVEQLFASSVAGEEATELFPSYGLVGTGISRSRS